MSKRASPPVRSVLREHIDAIYAAAAGFFFGVALFVPSLCGITDWTPVSF